MEYNKELIDKFFRLYYVKYYAERKPYDKVSENLGIERNKLKEIWEIIEKERKKEKMEVSRIKGIYNNKKDLKDFNTKDFPDFSAFYDWYISQFKKQNEACYYCESKEKNIRELFEAGVFGSKRIRGRHLEVERKDSNKGYSKENCVLCCYFCNNDKSDIFNETDYFEYLKNRKLYIDRKHKELIK